MPRKKKKAAESGATVLAPDLASQRGGVVIVAALDGAYYAFRQDITNHMDASLSLKVKSESLAGIQADHPHLDMRPAREGGDIVGVSIICPADLLAYAAGVARCSGGIGVAVIPDSAKTRAKIAKMDAAMGAKAKKRRRAA